jgi:hypothetical protein
MHGLDGITSMKAKVSSTTQKCMRLPQLIMRRGRLGILLAACLLTTCISTCAQDPKPTHEHVQTPTAKPNLPDAKYAETKVANEADPSSCVIKSDDPAIVTKSGESASSKKSGDQDGVSKASHNATPGESLRTRSSQEEWAKDQIDLGAEPGLREESRSEKPETGAGSDLKCAPHEGTRNTVPTVPN